MTRYGFTRRLAFCFTLTSILGSAVIVGGQPGEKNWPVIQVLHKTQTIKIDARSDTPVLALIRSAAGIPLYKMECHNGNYDDEIEINFSGDLQCALFAIKGRVVASPNLLAQETKEERIADWWNRGRMLARQLRGACLNYPEYSTVRHFRLRGMLITIGFDDVKWDVTVKDQSADPRLKSFTLILDAIPDRTAKNAEAEKPNGPAPPQSCYP